MVVRNNTAYLQTLQKKIPVARAVAALPVPEPPEGEQSPEGADEPYDSHSPGLMARETHGKLFDKLDLSSLDSWTPELADAACTGSWPNIMTCSPWILAELGLYPFHRTYNKSN